MRDVEEPTTNKFGDEVHPAYGMVRVSRVSCVPGVALFDSELRHGETIQVTVETATRRRDLHRDWLHGDRQVLEFELSMAQWAGLVSSVGTSGVPCTLRWKEGVGRLPDLPYSPRMAHSLAEVKEAAGKTFGKIEEALAEYEAVVEAKGGVKAQREALRKLHHVVAGVKPNLTFAAESLSEHAEDTVAKARADVEAMVTQHAVRLGLTSDQARGALELPQFTGEVSE